MLTSYYKGKISFVELMNMPLDVRKILHKLAWDKQNSEDKKDQEEIQADAVQGVLEEGGLM